MATLTDAQFDTILIRLRNQMRYGPLIEELADHVACATESYLDSGYDFEQAYNMALQHFGPEGLQQTEQDTLRISNPKLFRFMKIIRWALYFAYVLTAMGAIFKFMHWPSANENLLVGLGSIALCLLVSGFIRFETTATDAIKPQLFVAFRIVYLLGIALMAMGTAYRILKWQGGSQMIWMGFTAVAIAGLLVLLDFKRYKEFFAGNMQYLKRIYLAPMLVVVLMMCWHAFIYRAFQ